MSSKNQPEKLSSEDVKAHLDLAKAEGEGKTPDVQDQPKADPDQPKADPDAQDKSKDPDPVPSVVAEEKYYRCKKPTTYLKDHGTGIVFDGDAVHKSPLTGFLQSQIAAGKMEECESPE